MEDLLTTPFSELRMTFGELIEEIWDDGIQFLAKSLFHDKSLRSKRPIHLMPVNSFPAELPNLQAVFDRYLSKVDGWAFCSHPECNRFQISHGVSYYPCVSCKKRFCEKHFLQVNRTITEPGGKRRKMSCLVLPYGVLSDDAFTISKHGLSVTCSSCHKSPPSA